MHQKYSDMIPMKPTVYLLLFRGVGGKTQLPVKALREQLSEAGFENVATYINTGNAIVRSHWSRKKVIETVATLCREHLGFEKAILHQRWKSGTS